MTKSAYDYLNEQRLLYFDDAEGIRHYRTDFIFLESLLNDSALWQKLSEFNIESYDFIANLDHFYSCSLNLYYTKQVSDEADDTFKQTSQLINALKLKCHGNYHLRHLSDLLKQAITDQRHYANQRKYTNRLNTDARYNYFSNRLAEFFTRHTGDTQDKLIIICASIAFPYEYFASSYPEKARRFIKSRTQKILKKLYAL